MDSVNVSRVLLYWVSPFGNPRIKAHLRLPVAYRSLSRPSSALSAKAFPLRPLQLNLRRRSLHSIVSRQAGKLKCFVASPLQIRSASLGSNLVWVLFTYGVLLSQFCCKLLQELGKSRLILAIFVVDHLSMILSQQ